MDIHLPVKNGYEVSKILKMDPKTRAIPLSQQCTEIRSGTLHCRKCIFRTRLSC